MGCVVVVKVGMESGKTCEKGCDPTWKREKLAWVDEGREASRRRRPPRKLAVTEERRGRKLFRGREDRMLPKEGKNFLCF